MSPWGHPTIKGMRKPDDITSSLVLLPLIVVAIGVGIFAAYSLTVVASILGALAFGVSLLGGG